MGKKYCSENKEKRKELSSNSLGKRRGLVLI